MAEKGKLKIPRFSRGAWESGEVITRIGSGGVGGKASGLWRIQTELLRQLDPLEFPGIQVTVPRMVVLGAEIFDSFMELNGLREEVAGDVTDAAVAHAFGKATLPPEILGDLRDFIGQVHAPLAVRSSSLMEDALEHPFAGVFATKMIPNNQPDADSRFQALSNAIRFVYASTFLSEARDYFKAAGLDHDKEKMAVVLQEVVGNRHGDRFYPLMSGVARSFNYYPSGAARPTDGVVNLALGLGRQIVDGGLSWCYCPAYPAAPPPFNNLGDRMRSTQNEFWAVNMGPAPVPDPMKETEYLVQAGLEQGAEDGVLDHLVSTYDPRSDRLRMGHGRTGPVVLDFAPILVGETIALNGLLRRLFPLAERTAGCPVEIEFALDREGSGGSDYRLCLLQMRPMAVPEGESRLVPAELGDGKVIVAADRALGHGSRDDLLDVVYLKPEAFDAARTRAIADEVAGFNRTLVAEGRPYTLIGFGRWGSSDPWLGVPVAWSQIAGAKVIVETTTRDMTPDPSQGAHFFHNIIGLGVYYLTARGGEGGRIDWDWLDAQPVAGETAHVRHVRLVKPLEAKVDGLAGLGLLRRSS
ncbi:MAG: PEP/pyruvate-binding domain-containing protein [Candidatus Krumholzibacteriia bacterium]